jgi:hypothetical protein
MTCTSSGLKKDDKSFDFPVPRGQKRKKLLDLSGFKILWTILHNHTPFMEYDLL